MQARIMPCTVTLHASAANDTAVVEKTADQYGRSFCITAIAAGYGSSTASGTLTVKNDTETLFELPVVGAGGVFNFIHPIAVIVPKNKKLSVGLSSGGGGVNGYVTVFGYTL